MNTQTMKQAEKFNQAISGLCPFCGKDPWEAGFRDAISEREYQISGLCQSCQDEEFTESEG